jgi:hypothetical protein
VCDFPLKTGCLLFGIKDAWQVIGFEVDGGGVGGWLHGWRRVIWFFFGAMVACAGEVHCRPNAVHHECDDVCERVFVLWGAGRFGCGDGCAGQHAVEGVWVEEVDVGERWAWSWLCCEPASAGDVGAEDDPCPLGAWPGAVQQRRR